jgi:hypothetical protein
MRALQRDALLTRIAPRRRAGRALLLNTADDTALRGAAVRLANFGFAVMGGAAAAAAAPPPSYDPDDPDAAVDDPAAALAAAARADCSALGLALAELFFDALSLEGAGPSHRRRRAAPPLL